MLPGTRHHGRDERRRWHRERGPREDGEDDPAALQLETSGYDRRAAVRPRTPHEIDYHALRVSADEFHPVRSERSTPRGGLATERDGVRTEEAAERRSVPFSPDADRRGLGLIETRTPLGSGRTGR